LTDDDLGERIIGCAITVHSALGPGLLESVYEACLVYELSKAGIEVARQVSLPIRYEEVILDGGLKLDLLVGRRVVVELKATEKLLPIHTAQLLSYLRLSKLRVGYLLNFNVQHMRGGIKRVVNG
jgi:GxxExxY protein